MLTIRGQHCYLKLFDFGILCCFTQLNVEAFIKSETLTVCVQADVIFCIILIFLLSPTLMNTTVLHTPHYTLQALDKCLFSNSVLLFE